MKYFYVTRGKGEGFIATLSLQEIHSKLEIGGLNINQFATESDGRSFAEFQKSGDGNWRTLDAILIEYEAEIEKYEAEKRSSPQSSQSLGSRFVGGELSSLCLSIGQLAAFLYCVMMPFSILAKAQDARSPESIVALLSDILILFLSAAVFIVCRRAKTLERIAKAQDAENQLLWQAIEELRSEDGNPGADANVAT